VKNFFGQNLVSPVLGTAECGVRSAEGGGRRAEGGGRKAEGGMRSAECGVRNAECGMRSAECGVRNAECGMRSAECGVRNAECGRRSVACGRTGIQRDAAPTGLGVFLAGRVLQRFRPLRGLGCCWCDGFYRDFAPDGAWLAWGKRFEDDRDAAPTGLDLFLVGRVLQRWRAYGARGVGEMGCG
jgi:hypothetical protein